MSHVQAGTIAKNSRRKSALERLEKHLSEHPKNHNITPLTDKEMIKDFDTHDKIQKEELKHIKELVS